MNNALDLPSADLLQQCFHEFEQDPSASNPRKHKMAQNGLLRVLGDMGPLIKHPQLVGKQQDLPLVLLPMRPFSYFLPRAEEINRAVSSRISSTV
jgi:hypothetical protein